MPPLTLANGGATTWEAGTVDREHLRDGKLNFTVILGGLAVGLLNFGDRVGQISAGLFTLVALAAMIYALVTFHWRAKSIRMRGQGGFDDRFGPTVLAVALLLAIVVNFVLRITGAGGEKK